MNDAMINLKNSIDTLLQMMRQSSIGNTTDLRIALVAYINGVRDINRRCAICRNLINEGKFELCTQTAVTPYPLWEGAELLQKIDSTKVCNICELYEIELPEAINYRGVFQLRQECAAEDKLESVLRYYRANVRNFNVFEKIVLLRRIKRLDSNKSQWDRDLFELEDEYVSELKKQAIEAIEKHDLATLETCASELNSKDLMRKVEQKVLDGCAKKIREFKIDRLSQHAAWLIEKITNAYSALDEEALTQLFAQWQQEVLADELFAASGIDCTRINDPHKWLEEQQLFRQAEQERKHRLKQLLNALDCSADNQEVEKLYSKLIAGGNAVDEKIRRRVEIFLENGRLAAARKRRNRIVISSFAGAVLVILGLFFYNNYQELARRRTLLNFLEISIADKNFDAAANKLQEIKSNNPNLYMHPAVQAMLRKIDEAINNEKARLARFSALTATLNNISSQGFIQGELNYINGLNELANLAISTDEKTKVEQFKAAKQRFDDEKLAKLEQREIKNLERISRRIDVLESEAENMKFVKITEENQLLMSELDGIAQRGKSSNLLMRHVNDLQMRMQQVLNSSQQREDLRQKMSEKIAAIISDLQLGGPDNAEVNCNEFVAEFGVSGGSNNFVRTAKNIRQVINLCKLSRYKAEDFVSFSALWTEVQELGQSDNPWFEIAEKYDQVFQQLNLSELNDKLKAIIEPYAHYSVVRLVGNDKAEYNFYFSGKPQMIRKVDSVDIWGDALINNFTPSPIKIIGRGNHWLIPALFGKNELIGYTLADKNNFIPEYMTFWERMMIACNRERGLWMAEVIFNNAENLLHNEAINPLLRLELVRHLVEILQKSALPGFVVAELNKQFEKVDKLAATLRCQFFNITAEQSAQFNQMLRNMDIGQYKVQLLEGIARNVMLKEALNLQLTFAGIVALDEDGNKKVELMLPKENTIQELWSLNFKDNGEFFTDRIGVVRKNVFAPSIPDNQIKSGSIILAVSSGGEADKIVDSLKQKLAPGVKISFPAIWPRNCR